MKDNLIGKSIKVNRIAQNYTQKQLTQKIGVTHAAISYWENGVNIPNVKDCWLLADALGITIDELVGRDL
jgi:XRE family transcriptional regulator